MSAGGCAGFIGVELLGLAVVAVIGVAVILAKRLLKNRTILTVRFKKAPKRCFFIFLLKY